MPQLSLEQIRENVVLCPSLSEQHKIGLYFERLDLLITLHQRKSKWIQMFSEIFLGNSVSWVKFIRSVMKKDRMILKYCQFLYIMEFQMENWMPIY